ncbi:YrbL family protein [Celerinatantimonas sp. YJH-8]|uniref:YrbL family protein n=1 Tax=Celerinatantimonas sp. YJH-8 TaxID=3228714 RepID=UPI0038C6AA79
MIYLDDSLLIGKGSERACYIDPTCSSRCIKISHSQSKDDQNKNDFRYYHHLEKRGVPWEHIPRCFGWVQTNLGRGLTFKLLQNQQGHPLPSIANLLERGETTLEDLTPSLYQLRDYLANNFIFASDLRDSNIACQQQENGSYHLYLMDGLGYRQFIKLAMHWRWLGLRKIHDQWDHFYNYRMRRWHK